MVAILKRKRLRALLITLSLALLLGTFANAQTTVTFWNPFTGPDGETIEQMVQEFNETAGAEQGVQVELLIVPWDEYYTKLTVAIASGAPPDIAISHSDRILSFVSQGAFQEFPEESLEALGLEGESFITPLWEAGEVDGRRYAIPIDAFPRHMFYNRALFAEAGLDPDSPPTTLEEVIEAAQRITELGEDVWGLWFAKDGSWVARDFYALYWQFEPNLLSDDQRSVAPGFAEAARQVLEIMSSFINEYQVTPAETVAFELFVQDRVGMAFAQITHLLLLEQTPELDFASAPFPQFGDQPATFALGHNFVMPRSRAQSEERINASLVFFDWFANHSLDWAAGGKVPASLATIEDEQFASLTNQAVATSQLDYMKHPPAILQMPAVNEAVIDTLEEFYGGRLNVDQAVEQLVARINEALR